MSRGTSNRTQSLVSSRRNVQIARVIGIAAVGMMSPLAAADGTVAWRLPLNGTYAAHPGAVASDGTVYVQDVLGTVYAAAPNGELLWTYETDGIAEGPVVIGADRTIYASGNAGGADVSIHAVNPNGTRRWMFTDPGTTQGVIAGPAVGPDGHVYVVTELGGLGVFSLNGATGALRWNVATPAINERGQTGAGISFGPRTPGGPVNQCYTAFDMIATDSPTGQLFGFSLDGSLQLQVPIGGDANVGQFQPAAGSATGSVFVSSLMTAQGYRLRSFNANSGAAQWSYPADNGPPTNYLTQPTVGPDGTIYIMRNLGQIHAVNQNGSNRWIHSTSFAFNAPVADPTNNVVVVGGRITFGQPGFVKGLDVASGALLWTIDLPDEAGVRMIPMSRPWFSADGQRAYITTTLPGSSAGGYLYAIDLVTALCAADFNDDSAATVADIFAFLSGWFASDAAADFDGDSVIAVPDIFAFLGAWFAGC